MAKNVGNKLIFKDSEAAVASIMDSQKKEIAKLYEDWADEIGDKANFYSHKTTASAPLSERYYKELQKQLRETSQQVSNEVHGLIKNNMYLVSDAVVKDNVKWLEQFGFSQDGLNAAFSYVPDSVVRNLITGQIYESGWSLSSRIWSDNEQTLKDIYKIMAGGTAQQKSIYEISKDLEKYVRPSAAKPWNLVAADGRKIYPKQVDYNAQRLARTLTQHTYQQSFVAVTKNNPFVTEYIWRANGSRRCELCAARDGTHYKKDELPLDHPNGMCIMEPVVANNMIDQLADWFNSPDGTYPEIDAFAGNFGYNAKPMKEMKESAAKSLKESTAKSLAIRDNINLKNVSIRDASDSWFEFEEASAMKQYIRDGVLGTIDDYGIMRTQAEVNRLKEYALKLQEAAEKTITKYKRVYRGTVIKDADAGEVREMYKKGSTFTFDSLTATSPDKGIASIYTNTENFGEGTPVIFEIEAPNGIRGYARDEGEILIAKGQEYKITRQYFNEDDGMIHITLYKKK